MERLIDLIYNNQTFLLKRALGYAKQYGYTKFTSTLEEAWIASVSGLSNALMTALLRDQTIPEIQVDYDFQKSPIAAFGVMEAIKHRSRGISLEMFLSLMKYYRQAYFDLVTESVQEYAERYSYLLWILRFFDITEIAFCSEWNSHKIEEMLTELQQANRDLTNEKNLYLTIYESMPTPALILDANNHCTNMNYAAQQLLQKDKRAPGYTYYSEAQDDSPCQNLPWLKEEYLKFHSEGFSEKNVELSVELPAVGKRNLLVKFYKMLDVSEKFTGTVILLNDMTEYKRIEEQLREQGIRDQLTGLYNRIYMEEELSRLSSGRCNPVSFISIDVDGLKLTNDSRGHAAGDALLITVSRLIRKSFRQNDVIVRFGGDEFIVILPLCNEQTVKNSCRRLRSTIDRHNRDNPDDPVSLSIGWASGELHDTGTAREIIREADIKMYADKQVNRRKYETIFRRAIESANHGNAPV